MGRSERNYLLWSVFVAGMSTLAIEFTASRLIQSVYGTSNIVWANVIGLVLLCLTIGYFIGGKWADRYPKLEYFYLLLSVTGFAAVFFLLLTSFFLRTAAAGMASLNIGAVGSSLVGVILALAVPITLLGCISPFAIRLAVTDVTEVGRISGRIYAISTLGSWLGTYLPVLLVIPLAGTRATALIFGGILLGTGLIGLWLVNRKKGMYGLLLPIILAPFVYLWLPGAIKQDPGQIFESESAYNYIQVVRRGDCNYLQLNEGQAFHSFYCDDGRVPVISVWTIMLAAPYFNQDALPPEKMAVIGLAAGTIPKQFIQMFPDIKVDGIELDPGIVAVGQEYFEMNEPQLNVIVGDGRYELNRLTEKYDIITIDAYKVPYIPWHLTTREFFMEVNDHLSGRGIVAVNVGRVPNDRRLVEAMSSTMLTVFPFVHTIDVPGSLNSILVATVQPTRPEYLSSYLATAVEIDPLLQRALETAVVGIVPTVSADFIFTDERAPVETLIDSLVIGYLLDEGPYPLLGFEE